MMGLVVGRGPGPTFPGSEGSIEAYANELRAGTAESRSARFRLGGKTNDLRQQLMAIAGKPAVWKADCLIGLSRGQHKHLGRCMFEGRPVQFDLWFPYVGIAVDLHGVAQDERDHKFAWCRERSVMYFSPPFELLDVQQFVIERRRAMGSVQ